MCEPVPESTSWNEKHMEMHLKLVNSEVFQKPGDLVYNDAERKYNRRTGMMATAGRTPTSADCHRIAKAP
jgi:hypothetical protein